MTDKNTGSSEGRLPPLTVANLDQEVEGMYEDLLNWDHGHPIELPLVKVGAAGTTHKTE